jgi:SagB-type dehydrogenase family enzyme
VSGTGGEPWYLEQAQQGERLLDHHRPTEAASVFTRMLERLGAGPSYPRAVVMGRLARCARLEGRPDAALAQLHEAIELTGRLPPSEGVKGLRGMLRSELGDALRGLGRYDQAERAYRAALAIAKEVRDRRAEGIEQGRLGALALARGEHDEALTRYHAALSQFEALGEAVQVAVTRHQLGRVHRERHRLHEADAQFQAAARLSAELGDAEGAARSLHQLALVHREAGRPDLAESWLRQAVRACRAAGDAGPLASLLRELADLLREPPPRLAEARALVEESLAITERRDPLGAEVWAAHGLLAEICEAEAAESAGDEDGRALLRRRARDSRELHHRAPLILAAAAGLPQAPSCGRAVILERLGRCYRLAGRADLAAAYLREALGIAGSLPPSDEISPLRGMLHVELGEVLREAGRADEAAAAFEAALAIAIERRDTLGRTRALERLGAGAAGPAEQSAGAPRLPGVVVEDEVSTEYVFDSGLLADGPRERTTTLLGDTSESLPGHLRPALVPCVRSWQDGEGAVRFALPPGEPLVTPDPGCTVMRRTRREVVVSGNTVVLWRLIEALDGGSAVSEVLAGLPLAEHEVGATLLARLAAAGVVDASGRSLGRFLHWATKKGVLPAGGLEGDGALRLAADGDHRVYPAAPRVAIGREAPAGRLGAFHALTRSRRSARDYAGLPLSRGEFDALLSTACGITGALPWAGGEVTLRAYPSSGALYAVEIYPVVFRVEGLEPAVYHFRALGHELERVKPAVEHARFLKAALPTERGMLAGVSAMFCLAGNFLRHERKYGQGAYRMLVAEAGHVSQNLVLAATALELGARPFGGVFDDLLNHELGLESSEEQFLLSVLVGRPRS